MFSSQEGADNSITVILNEQELSESSEDQPIEHWPSYTVVLPEQTPKRKLYNAGLYRPRSRKVCTKYIAQSDSDILKHVYFHYPRVKDPGIFEALLSPEVNVYGDDGQELYLAVCNEMRQCPVRAFHRGLLESEIDLKYYCVNPAGVRAMALALRFNTRVKDINLTENYLNEDACYHLGDMLMKNCTIQALDLTGCRIGPKGALRLLAGLPMNRGLQKLVLNKNQLGDEGGELVANAIYSGMDVPRLGISDNHFGNRTALALSEAFVAQNNLTHLDLSRNYFFVSPSTISMLKVLSTCITLREINLSYNALAGVKIGVALEKLLLSCPDLTVFNLSNNKLQGQAVASIAKSLPKAINLVTLDLSSNPLSISNAMSLVEKLESSVLRNLLLENVTVDEKFLEILKQLLLTKECIVTYGDVVKGFVPKEIDIRELLLKRADVVATTSKKHRIDIAIWCMQQFKEGKEIMSLKDFANGLRHAGCKLEENLLNSIVDTFLACVIPKKGKFVDIVAMVDYMSRLWPDRKLPPTPPPEPIKQTPQTRPMKKVKKKQHKKR